MRTVYRADSLIDAHLLRGRLEAEGVAAWVIGDLLTGGMGDLPVSGLLQVCVADVDEAEAQAHLARWEAERERGLDGAGELDALPGPA